MGSQRCSRRDGRQWAPWNEISLSESRFRICLRIVVNKIANNPLERILREIRQRTRVVGAFHHSQSALNLAAARLRHIAGTTWSTKRYLNIEPLKDQQMRAAITA